MHIEVKYPVGTEVWVRGKVKSVDLMKCGIEYQVIPSDDKFWDSMRVKEESLTLVLPNGT